MHVVVVVCVSEGEYLVVDDSRVCVRILLLPMQNESGCARGQALLLRLCGCARARAFACAVASGTRSTPRDCCCRWEKDGSARFVLEVYLQENLRKFSSHVTP
jgi:hypothetical protein